MKKKPILFVTDIWRDVDDALALTYVAWSKDLELAWIVTTKMIPQKRALISKIMCESLWLKNIPIWSWSIYPIFNEDPAILEKYLLDTQIDWVSFEWQWILPENVDPDSIIFENTEDVILKALEEYWDKLYIAILAPTTDIARVILKERKKFEHIAWIYIMWLANENNWVIEPSNKSYNLRLDMNASDILFSLQDKVPLTFLSKFAAYTSPLTKSDFKKFVDTDHMVWKYLDTHARKVLECSLKWNPYVLKRILKIPDDVDLYEGYRGSQNLSNPYDPLTVMAISNPELFESKHIWEHKVIWVSNEENWVISVEKCKAELINGILSALNNTNLLTN